MHTLDRLTKKITFTLLAGQSLFSAAMIMVSTVSSIIAVQLAGDNTQWTGVPITLVVIGAAIMAYPSGKLMGRVGRRPGLSLGYVLGIIGTLIAGFAVINQHLLLFLLGVFILGFTKGVLDQGRYAAAEASSTAKRARAISWVVLGGTAGSILGPSLISASGKAAENLGLPLMSGPWFVAAALFGLMLLLINIMLRPDPKEIGEQWAKLEQADTTDHQHPQGNERAYKEIMRDTQARVATAALIFGQLAMVVVMTMTPVHMHHNNHALGSISLVIMAHTLGMFGLSFVTGWLADKLGRNTMILTGGLVLAMACVVAPLSNSVPWLAVSLFLLGLGWNFCFVSGSTLLSDVLHTVERGRVQGLTDTMVNIVSAGGSTIGGLIFAATGYMVISWLTIGISLVPVALVIFLRVSQRREMVVEGALSN